MSLVAKGIRDATLQTEHNAPATLPFFLLLLYFSYYVPLLIRYLKEEERKTVEANTAAQVI